MKARKVLSAEQTAAVEFPRQGLDSPQWKHLVIEAGAGAGKTTLLTERVRRLLTSNNPMERLDPQELVLVTFSRAADEELRTRVERELESALPDTDTLERLLARLHMSTIDSLFMQLANNLFPLWWEQKRAQLSSEVLRNWRLEHQRFAPPLTLVSEEELRPELAEQVISFMEKFSADANHEIASLDFILAGAFESKNFSRRPSSNQRYQGIERIAAAMLGEHLLREDAPPLQFALERIHPTSLSALSGIKSMAEENFHRRLMHGRMTHNDRMLFLYHLIALQGKLSATSFFIGNASLHIPLRCKELIVDEYQDTNQLQHEILSALIDPLHGRMVVVGDPKQSIYGFRSAHVGVFQNLKRDAQWKLIELTQNFRSHPDLLPLINALSQLSFAYQNNRIPEEFRRTGFSHSAKQTYVESKDLDAGRSDAAQPQAPAFARLLMLGASLFRNRCLGEYPEDPPQQHAFTAWALAKELRALVDSGEFLWSQMAVLCETNDGAIKTQEQLVAAGIPATARITRTTDRSMSHKRRSENIGLTLAKWLCFPLSVLEFAELLWSGWIDLTQDEASQLLAAAAGGQLNAAFIQVPEASKDSSPSNPPAVPVVWQRIEEHLQSSRTLAARHFFSGWQVFRWGFAGTPSLQRNQMNVLMENVAIVLHQMLDVWSIRSSFESAAHRLALHSQQPHQNDPDEAHQHANKPQSLFHWPEELIQNQLNQLRLEEAQPNPNSDAVVVSTVHGAKGLEWPVVVFWPSSKRERTPENFVLKAGSATTHVKWLAEDTESASLLPWIANPNPPQDVVSITLENDQGERLTRWSADLQDRLEQDYERQRVFYTAYTRAREVLILVSPAVSGRTLKNLRDKLSALKEGDPFDTEKLSLNGIESAVFGHFADHFFDLRKEAKRGATPKTPWMGLELEARLKDDQWNGIVALRDYGPDWVSVLQPKSNTPVENEEEVPSPALPDHWQEAWALQRSQRALQTPWLKSEPPADLTRLSESDTRKETSQERLPTHEDVAGQSQRQENLSAAETGLRFHALMEHSAPSSASRNESFIQRLLQNATVREHELELWSSFAVSAEVDSNGKNELYKTQRRIIDLFCVIPSSAWPKKLWNAPCVPFGEKEQSTVQAALQETLLGDRHIHLVVDFKTGTPKTEHLVQMQTYLRWVKHILLKQPQLLVKPSPFPTLFSPSDKPLLGILYYTSANIAAPENLFASCLISVDKNASVLFVSPE